MSGLLLREDDIYRGDLILVNAKHRVRKKPKRDMLPLSPDKKGVKMEAGAAAMYLQLMREIGHGDEILPVSGYRPVEEQEAIYRESVEQNGEEFTKRYVALPGRSEHQTGLAIDVGENKEKVDFICPEFPYTGICGRFREKAAGYGFIERYRQGKEKITGIAPEPWHFRYVGYPHAEIIREMGVCFEEYIDIVKKYRFDGPRLIYRRNGRRIEIFYVPFDGGARVLTMPDAAPYRVSGNNVDGFVVTVFHGYLRVNSFELH